MRMCSIASGSRGNCIYVGSDNTHLLVDTGISKKRIEEGLKTLDLKGNDLNGILITHEHSDHIQGLGGIQQKVSDPDLCHKRYIRRNKKLFRTRKDAGGIISSDPYR